MYADPSNFEQEAMHLCLTTGLITGIASYIISGYLGMRVIQRFKKENLEEEIKFIFEIPFLIRFMLPFILGGFVGYYLVPFFYMRM